LQLKVIKIISDVFNYVIKNLIKCYIYSDSIVVATEDIFPTLTSISAYAGCSERSNWWSCP